MPGVESVKLPEALYQQIRERARASGRTGDEQAAELLNKALGEVAGADADAKEVALMAEIRAEREKLNVPFLTEAELQRMKWWGRE